MRTQSCIVITILVICMLNLLPLEATVQKKPPPKFDILEILGSKGTFGTFISLLNQTKLADEINARDTITVLAVDDGAIGDLSSKSLDRIKDILSTHVILDYYDVAKLQLLSSKLNTTVTTMYQATGVASNLQGYLKIVAFANVGTEATKKIRIGSAVKGAPIDIALLSDREFAYKKYDYVIHSVSGVIFTPGIDGMVAPPTRSPIPVAPPHSNTNTSASAPSPDAVDDYDMAESDGATPAKAPSPSPSMSDNVDAPTADDASTTPPPPSKSSGTQISLTYFTTLIVVVVSSFAYAVL